MGKVHDAFDSLLRLSVGLSDILVRRYIIAHQDRPSNGPSQQPSAEKKKKRLNLLEEDLLTPTTTKILLIATVVVIVVVIVGVVIFTNRSREKR